MNKTRKPRRFIIFSLTAILTAVLIIISGFYAINTALAMGDDEDTLASGYCVRDDLAGANCTAYDVRIKYLRIVNLEQGCNDVNDPGWLIADFEVVIEAAQPNRYDIGFYIATDGGSALYDQNDLINVPTGVNACYHGYLSGYIEPLNTNPTYTDWYLDTIPDIFDYHPTTFNGFYTSGVDVDPTTAEYTCGDMLNQTQAIRYIEDLRVKCNDGSGDGIIDINTCASWNNVEKDDCWDVTQAIPVEKSKCGCEYVNLYGPNEVVLTSLNASSSASSSLNWLIPTIVAVLFLGSTGVILLVKKLTPQQI